jgi:hypothetical protein
MEQEESADTFFSSGAVHSAASNCPREREQVIRARELLLSKLQEIYKFKL